jgi:hypothetical protein
LPCPAGEIGAYKARLCDGSGWPKRQAAAHHRGPNSSRLMRTCRLT